MAALGFSTTIDPVITVVEGAENFHFSFHWDGRNETSSYEPLQLFLNSKGIHTRIVGSGSGLSRGLLYEVDIYSLKQRGISSEILRTTDQEPKLIFKLSGRTDLVTLVNPENPIINGNVKYFIEIKTVQGFNNKASMREAILQLIGGNVGALYHSPPVLLTNLNQLHFVLFITQVDDDIIFYHKLNVLKMDSFSEAVTFLENHTKVLKSVTRNFARMPTPRPSRTVNESSESINVELIDTSEDIDGLDALVNNVNL
jgi:hypothetical protein